MVAAASYSEACMFRDVNIAQKQMGFFNRIKLFFDRTFTFFYNKNGIEAEEAEENDQETQTVLSPGR